MSTAPFTIPRSSERRLKRSAPVSHMSSEVTLRCSDSSSSSPEGGEGAATVPTPLGERICHYYHRAVAWAKEHPKVFWSIVLVIIAFVALLIAASFLPVDAWLQSAQNYAKSNMTTSILLIFFLIFIGAFSFLPIALLETAGSFLFGWQIGFPLTFAAYWSGSCLALLVGRYWFTAYAHTFLESLGSRGAVINRMIASHPFKMSMFVRLSVLPITVKNYVLSALPVSTWTYVITSMLGHLPFAIIYAFIGSSVSNISDILHGSNPAATVGLVLGILFAVVLVWAIQYYYSKMEAEIQNEPVQEAASPQSSSSQAYIAGVDDTVTV